MFRVSRFQLDRKTSPVISEPFVKSRYRPCLLFGQQTLMASLTVNRIPHREDRGLAPHPVLSRSLPSGTIILPPFSIPIALSMSVCMSVCLSVCLSVSLSLFVVSLSLFLISLASTGPLSLFLYFCLPLSTYLSRPLCDRLHRLLFVYLSACLSPPICFSTIISILVSVYIYVFIFSPLSHSSYSFPLPLFLSVILRPTLSLLRALSLRLAFSLYLTLPDPSLTCPSSICAVRSLAISSSSLAIPPPSPTLPPQ